MGAVVVVLSLLGGAVLYGYLAFPPPYAKKDLVRVFDWMVLFVCGLLCLFWFLDVRLSWQNSEYARLAIPIGMVGVLVIESVFLGIAFLVRNFWLFKPPSRPGGGFRF